jgi:SAM-dependent methyltransferase
MDHALRLHAQRARTEIASGALRGTPLVEMLLAVPARDRDDWADELLGLESPPPDAHDLPRGSVPYLPCGVDEILTVLRDVPIRPDDTLVDLGSGLGRVAILVHLLGGARTSGIEIQEHLVRRARAVCEALGVPDVSFVHGDAAEAALDGSIFFLYAPFNGRMLTAVLRRIEDVARRRSIVVCTVGVELGGLAWLRPRESSSASVSLYDSP